MTPRWPQLASEADRLEAVRRLRLLDTPHEERFDRITRLAGTILSVPVALISLVDADRQWFKSKLGVQADQIPRDQSVCGYAIGCDLPGPLAITDATEDDRFADLPAVRGDTHLRSYLGQVLRVDGRGATHARPSARPAG